MRQSILLSICRSRQGRITDLSAAVPLILSHQDASLLLLLRIAETRLGAANVVNSGLFGSIRDSGIFSADPDIGLGEFKNIPC